MLNIAHSYIRTRKISWIAHRKTSLESVCRRWNNLVPTVSNSTSHENCRTPSCYYNFPFVDSLCRAAYAGGCVTACRFHELQNKQIPGGAVVIVQGTEILLMRGYGYADLQASIKVDPAKTLFRIGSVTKPFTATAILQLFEEGGLQLHSDVRQYADFLQIQYPVTISQLLTHTGGFEERLAGTGARTEREVLPLKLYLAKEMPAQVLLPGRFFCYSNHGYTLLGSIIEKNSGLTMKEYLEKKIFKPLQMNDTQYGFSKNIVHFARGYVSDGKAFVAVDQSYLQIGPAADISSTAEDMSHFLMAQLNDGKFGGASILKPETISLMHRRQFSQHPDLPGMSYGFYQSFYNHQQGYYHTGGIRGFAAMIYLIPEKKLGIFIANNGNDQSIGFKIVDPFLNRYFPALGASMESATISGERSHAVEGMYRFLRYSRTNIEKLALLNRRDVIVKMLPEGLLDVGGVPFVEKKQWLFQQVGSYEQVALLKNSKEQVTHLAYDQDVLEKISWYESSAFQQLLFFLFLVLQITVFWGMDPFVRATKMARSMASVNLLFFAGLLAGFLFIGPGRIWSGIPWPFVILLSLPLISIVPAALMVRHAIAEWVQLSFVYRMRIVILSFGAAAFLIYLNSGIFLDGGFSALSSAAVASFLRLPGRVDV